MNGRLLWGRGRERKSGNEKGRGAERKMKMGKAKVKSVDEVTQALMSEMQTVMLLRSLMLAKTMDTHMKVRLAMEAILREESAESQMMHLMELMDVVKDMGKSPSTG